MVSAAFPNRPFNLRDNVWFIQTDVANNRSLVGWELWVDQNTSYRSYSGGKANRWMRLDGGYVANTTSNGFDFNGGNGSHHLINSGQAWIGHNSDGTKSLLIEAAADFDILGYTSLSVWIGLPTIPRASTISSISPSQHDNRPDQVTTLGWSRASTNFKHWVGWTFGSASGAVADNRDTDATWTPPWSILDQIPNAMTGVGNFRLDTYNGSSGKIGETYAAFRINVPSTVVPTSTGFTLAEAEAGVVAVAGSNRFIQNVSRLTGTITGAAGARGSTVKEQKFVVGSQTVIGATGTTPQPITVSGSNTEIVATVTDSRGQTSTRSAFINVVPYNPPAITDLQLRRIKSAATPYVADPESGEYVLVKSPVTATSVSAAGGGTGTVARIRIQAKKRSETTWTTYVDKEPGGTGISADEILITNPFTVTTRARSGTTATITTSTAHGLAIEDTVTISGVNNSVFNGTFIVTGVPTATKFTFTTSTSGTVSSASSPGTVLVGVKFPATEPYDVRVIFSDRLSEVSALTVLPVGAVFMHWSTGLGVGKFWEQGMLDVAGDIHTSGRIYQNNGIVLDRNSHVTATLSDGFRGGGWAHVKIDGVMSSVPYKWVCAYDPSKSRRVRLQPISNGEYVIVSQEEEDWVPLAPYLASGWMVYNEMHAENEWALPKATRLSSGLIVLSGLIKNANGNVASTAPVMNLPVGFRPGHQVIYNVNNGDQAKAVTIGSDGKVSPRGSWIANQYISLDGITFWDPAIPEWIPIGQEGSSWGVGGQRNTGWDEHGVPSFWKDPWGVVWFRGLIQLKNGGLTDNTNLVTLPPGYRSDTEQHYRTAGNDGYSGLGAKAADGLNWKTNSPNTSGQWISMDPIKLHTPESRTKIPFRSLNGWANSANVYSGAGTQFPYPSVARREDGLCLGAGMVNMGPGLGTGRIAVMGEREVWPSGGRLLMDGVTSNARARFDLGGFDEYESARKKGGISVVNGVAGAWFSLDGTAWVP